jgi:tetrapyrrole methylase family protein/MazG family protein
MSEPSAFDAVVDTVHRLRAPGGCPWDREQTHQSLRAYLIEESAEVLEVLDQIQNPEDLKDPKRSEALREELGDLWMQILLHSEMAREAGAFDIHDVARTLNEKLIRRHPHVFGNAPVADAQEVVENWEKIKRAEKSAPSQSPKSALDGIPRSLPALQRCEKIIDKVSKVGFQWPDWRGPLSKIEEETQELRIEIEKFDHSPSPKQRQKIEQELGDLLFTICNVASVMKVRPEDALRTMLTRFEGRFRHIETELAAQGKQPSNSTLEEMDALWEAAKKKEQADT